LFSATDPHGASSTGAVLITVTPVNDPPVAGDDLAQTCQQTVLVLAIQTLLANDSDVDGDELRITSVSSNSIAGGEVALSEARITYSPPGTFSGTDSFVYTVSDGRGGSASATVSIDVGLLCIDSIIR